METNNIKRIEDFRLFQADEIKVREGSGYMSNGQKKKTLLLYQDARAAMRRLDERFGEYGWQREHKDVHGVTYCGVSLWDASKGCWVTKWDAGEPSRQSKEKGEASDSFKRACVNWGIGRELYTAPFIGVEESVQTNNLKVTAIEYDDARKICALTIADRQGNIIYQYRQKNAAEPKKTAQTQAVPQSEDQAYLVAYNECVKAHSRDELQELWNRYKGEPFSNRLSPKITEILNIKNWA